MNFETSKVASLDTSTKMSRNCKIHVHIQGKNLVYDSNFSILYKILVVSFPAFCKKVEI